MNVVQQPKVVYYAKFVYDNKSGKSPLYLRVKVCGYYPPLERLTFSQGRNKGKIGFYLMGVREEQPLNAPKLSLQAVKSLNFTGLKGCVTLDGVAYGFPSSEVTYSKNKLPNPFYEYREDGYLFVFHQDQKQETPSERLLPTSFELLILEGGKKLISSYFQQMQLGYYDALLKECREKAVLCAESVEAEKR